MLGSLLTHVPADKCTCYRFQALFMCQLQEMRTYKEAEQAGKNVGFHLVMSYDIATASPVSGPW